MSVASIGLPVIGSIGFALTSTLDAWTAGYDEPGFWGTAGLTLTGTGVELSILGVTESAADFGTPVGSVEGGRWVSLRKLA